MENEKVNAPRKRTTKKKLVITAIALTILIVGAIVVLPLFSSKTTEDTVFYIYPNTTEAALKDSLQNYFGEKIARKVIQLNGTAGKHIENCVGRYYIPAGTSPIRLWKKLAYKEQQPFKFTFNNLRTLDDFAERAGGAFCFSKDDMLKCLTSAETCKEYGMTKETIPAMLIPDTYEFYWTATPEQVLKKIHAAYKEFWNDGRRKKAKELGLTPTEVSTLASIVEEETAQPTEKGKVARLYLNRLEKGIMLQSDPTVKFAVGDFQLQRVMHKHLEINSPYNTYRNLGLPPGPIRLPEKTTLDAVLNAPQHNYIFMCAKEDFSGFHNFTASPAEHMANARRYQAALNRLGIK